MPGGKFIEANELGDATPDNQKLDKYYYWIEHESEGVLSAAGASPEAAASSCSESCWRSDARIRGREQTETRSSDFGSAVDAWISDADADGCWVHLPICISDQDGSGRLEMRRDTGLVV